MELSWFSSVVSDRASKLSHKNIKELNKTVVPMTLNGLLLQEKNQVLKIYDKKIPINMCPLYFSQLSDRTEYLSESDRKGKYARSKCSVIHVGQRKLLMTEVWFLSLFGLQKLKKGEKGHTMIYPGAGPGTHILYLARLFPNVTMHLYDMSKFDQNLLNKKTRPRNVILHKSLFLENESNYWKKRSENGENIYLVSDIRASVIENKEDTVDEDNLLQYRWIENIKPKGAMIKWRVPHRDKEYTKGKPYKYKYLDGEILMQPWGGVTTTETRLIVNNDKPYKYISMSAKVYEEKCASLNNVTRTYGYFKHNIPCSGFEPYDKVDKNMSNSGFGLDHCWNCSSELLVWCLYLGMEKNDILNGDERKILKFMHSNTRQLIKLFNNTTKSICRQTLINCHGLLPNKTFKEKIDYFTDMDNPNKKEFESRIRNKNYSNYYKCFYEYNKKDELFYTKHSGDKVTQTKKDTREINRRKKDVKKVKKST